VLAVLTLASVAATAAAQTRAAVNDGVQQLAEKAASGRWDRFSAHIIVKRGWISSAAAGGLAVRPPVLPADLIDEYVWERARTVNGWHTTVTLVAATAGSVQTSTGRVSLPLDRAVRMEDAEDGTAPKFFDRDGVPLLPSSAPAWERFTAMTRTPQGTVALDGAQRSTTPSLNVTGGAEETGPDGDVFRFADGERHYVVTIPESGAGLFQTDRGDAASTPAHDAKPSR